MPSHLLLAWMGRTDLKAAAGDPDAGVGPIAQGVQAGTYDTIHLLSDFPAAEAKSYIKWLASRTGAAIHLHSVKLTSPINFGEIYERVVEVLEVIDRRGTQLTYHLSPGTPAMAYSRHHRQVSRKPISRSISPPSSSPSFCGSLTSS